MAGVEARASLACLRCSDTFTVRRHGWRRGARVFAAAQMANDYATHLESFPQSFLVRIYGAYNLIV